MVNVYGSQYYCFIGKLVWDQGQAYSKMMTLTKVHTKALDQQSERCTSSSMTPNTSACVARFVEGQIGCRMNSRGSMNLPPCNSTSQLSALMEINNRLRFSDANTLYKMTGCLAPCERDEYQKIEREADILFLKHSSRIIRQSFNPACGSWKG